MSKSLVELDLKDGRRKTICDRKQLGPHCGVLGAAAYDRTRDEYYVVDGTRRTVIRYKPADAGHEVVYRFGPVESGGKFAKESAHVERLMGQVGSHFAAGTRLDVTSDGTWLLFSARGAGLFAWRIDTGEPRLLFEEDGDPVSLIRCTPRGVFVGRSSGLYVLDPQDGKLDLRTSSTGRVEDVSPDGRLVLCYDSEHKKYNLRRVDGGRSGLKLDVEGFNAAVQEGWPTAPRPLFISGTRVAYQGLYGWVLTMPKDGLLTYDFRTGRKEQLADTAGLRLCRYYDRPVTAGKTVSLR